MKDENIIKQSVDEAFEVMKRQNENYIKLADKLIEEYSGTYMVSTPLDFEQIRIMFIQPTKYTFKKCNTACLCTGYCTNDSVTINRYYQ